MKREGTSKEFYITLIIIAIIFLIIGFYFLPQNRYIEFIGNGSSMEPTFYDGDVLIVDPKRTPNEMDMIVFSCHTCKHISEEEILTKRIYEVDAKGCFWLLGDNQLKSHDSTEFGWLCEEDLQVYGVVVGTKKENN